jgi:hypothetical protein
LGGTTLMVRNEKKREEKAKKAKKEIPAQKLKSRN